jgi:hypothetical protein
MIDRVCECVLGKQLGGSEDRWHVLTVRSLSWLHTFLPARCTVLKNFKSSIEVGFFSNDESFIIK